MTQLQEQKRKIILLFKEYKIYPQFRAVVNLMAAVADYTWRLDDVPEFFRTNANPYKRNMEQEKTHIGQFNKEEIESLMEWITKTFKQIRNLLQDKKQNNLTQQEIINKYYTSNMIDIILNKVEFTSFNLLLYNLQKYYFLILIRMSL